MNVTGGHSIDSLISKSPIILRNRSSTGTALTTPPPHPANTVHGSHTIHHIKFLYVNDHNYQYDTHLLHNLMAVFLIASKLSEPPTMLQSCSLVSAYEVVRGDT
jgi:hypothetical protein